MMRTMTVRDEDASPRGRLGELYARHAPDAARLAYLLTGDRALAEDLVQEAFVRMFGRFRDLRNPEAFGAYLRKTVVNLSRSHFRRLKVERAYTARRAVEPAATAATNAPEPGDAASATCCCRARSRPSSGSARSSERTRRSRRGPCRPPTCRSLWPRTPRPPPGSRASGPRPPARGSRSCKPRSTRATCRC